MAEPPLSSTLSAITTFLPYTVFAVSIIAGVIGIVGDEIQKQAFNRGPDYSCFLLDLIDLVLLTCNALLHKMAWFKKKTKEQQEKFEKRQQLIDNVLAEVLLYPSIICSIITVTTDRPWEYDYSDVANIDHDQRLVGVCIYRIALLLANKFSHGCCIYSNFKF